MKKFFFRLFTSAVKGMPVAVCIELFSVSVLAQNSSLVNKPDSIPFHKWEVSLDVKPLFRSDAPYNIMAKWHFSERGALRLGLGTTILAIAKDSFGISQTFFDYKTQISSFQYNQMQFGPNDTKYINWDLKIGYQYEFQQGKICLYSASDFNWKIERTIFQVPVQSNILAQGMNDTFVGYRSLDYLYNRKSFYRLIQSLGLKYNFSNNISCSFETSLIFQLLNFRFITNETPYLPNANGLYQKITGQYGSETSFIFNPLMGLFINYHF